MARRQVLVQLTDELVRKLDRLRKEKGRSRSALVRDAVERYVTHESNEEKDRRLIEGYTRFPPDGEFDAVHEEAARRMVEEEPW